MVIDLVDLGTFPNDGTGDDLRTAFEKVNANFTNIDNSIVIGALNIGAGTGVFASKSGDNLEFKSLVSGANINISTNANTITIAADTLLGSVSDDPNPTLGGNLSLNNFSLNGLRITETISTVNLSAGVKSLSLTGTVSSINNHNIGALGNVSDSVASTGQSLVWLGTQWGPGNATGVDFSFIDFDGTFTNPIQYLLEQQDIDFGPFIFTSFDTEVELNLGTF
jgi:hypothetical protein